MNPSAEEHRWREKRTDALRRGARQDSARDDRHHDANEGDFRA